VGTGLVPAREQPLDASFEGPFVDLPGDVPRLHRREGVGTAVRVGEPSVEAAGRDDDAGGESARREHAEAREEGEADGVGLAGEEQRDAGDDDAGAENRDADPDQSDGEGRGDEVEHGSRRREGPRVSDIGHTDRTHEHGIAVTAGPLVVATGREGERQGTEDGAGKGAAIVTAASDGVFVASCR
jgi:hypothetical protein